MTIRTPSGDHHPFTFSPWSIIDVGVRERKDNTTGGFEACEDVERLQELR